MSDNTQTQTADAQAPDGTPAVPANPPPAPATARGGATSQQRDWRVDARLLVPASDVNEALDGAEQALRSSGTKGKVRVSVFSESTGETGDRTVEI